MKEADNQSQIFTLVLQYDGTNVTLFPTISIKVNIKYFTKRVVYIVI